METYEVLEQALAIIEKPGGWLYGYRFLNGKESVCALGAISKVAGGLFAETDHPDIVTALARGVIEDDPYNPAGGMTAKAIAQHAPGKLQACRVAAKSNQGQEEAVDMFKRAIRLEKERVASEVPETTKERTAA